MVSAHGECENLLDGQIVYRTGPGETRHNYIGAYCHEVFSVSSYSISTEAYGGPELCPYSVSSHGRDLIGHFVVFARRGYPGLVYFVICSRIERSDSACYGPSCSDSSPPRISVYGKTTVSLKDVGPHDLIAPGYGIAEILGQRPTADKRWIAGKIFGWRPPPLCCFSARYQHLCHHLHTV